MDSFLRQHPLIKPLPLKEHLEIEKELILGDYPRGTAIFEENDPPRAVYLVRTGLIKAVKHSPRADPITMEIIVPGGLTGLVAVLDKKPYSISALALQDSSAYQIPVFLFEHLMKQSNFSHEVFRNLGSQIRHG